jgi:hypothetical protein
MTETRTLGLLEDTLVDTSLESAVEVGVEHGISELDVVVALDVLLQGLTGRAVAVLELGGG